MATQESPSLYERLGGVYGIAAAVDVLVDRLYSNASANMNPAVAKFHEQQGQPGFKFLVTAWTIEHTGGPKCYPGRDMRDAHVHLNVSQHGQTVQVAVFFAIPLLVELPPAAVVAQGTSLPGADLALVATLGTATLSLALPSDHDPSES